MGKCAMAMMVSVFCFFFFSWEGIEGEWKQQVRT